MQFESYSETGPYLAVGHKIRIRPMERRDIDERHTWPPFSDPLFANLNPKHLTKEERDKILERRQAYHDWRWYTILEAGGAMIGEIALREIDTRKCSARLGIHLRSDFVGQGYGTDAVRTFLEYFFHVLKYKTLYLDVAEHNKRAIRVYEKCGFRIIGRHLSVDRSGLDIFGDPRFEEIRPYFEMHKGKVHVKFLDMVIVRQESDNQI